MKIALVIERMDPALGGREVYTAQVAAALARRGHGVAVVCQTSAWSADGVEIVVLGRRGRTRRGRLANFVADAQAALRDRDDDLTHAMLPVPGLDFYQPHGGTVPGQVAAGLWRRRGLARLVARVGYTFNRVRRLQAGHERQVVADPRICCLCVSRLVAEEFKVHYGRTENVRILFNGAETPDPDSPERERWRTARRSELGARSGAPVFVCVAANFRRKGVAEMMEAFAAWSASCAEGGDARLVIVGRTRVEPYERLAARLGIAAAVRFVPPTSEIFQWYAAADAVVLLSWYDTCGLVLIEAVRWGIPAVTTRLAGAWEIVSQGAGVVVDSPADTAAAAAAFEALADPARRAACAEVCRRLAPRLTIDRHVDELLAAYAEVTGRD